MRERGRQSKIERARNRNSKSGREWVGESGWERVREKESERER